MGLLLMSMAKVSMVLTAARGPISWLVSVIVKIGSTCIHIVGAFLIFNGAFLEHAKDTIEQLIS